MLQAGNEQIQLDVGVVDLGGPGVTFGGSVRRCDGGYGAHKTRPDADSWRPAGQLDSEVPARSFSRRDCWRES